MQPVNGAEKMKKDATNKLKALAPAVAAMLAVTGLLAGTARADNAAELARKIQDPLADLAALQVDYLNKQDIGDDRDTSHSLILQPLYTIDGDDYNLVTRQLIPVLGVPSTDGGGSGHVWGLGDIVSSAFFSPKSDQEWKWGVGPQVSLKTRSREELGGAGWGGGVTSVLVGATGPRAFAIFLSQLWDFDGTYSTATFQPLVFYNIEAVPGLMLSYQGEITSNWKAEAGQHLNLPLGLQVGKMFDVGGNWGFQLDVGAYSAVVRPDGAAEWEMKVTAFLLAP